MLLILSRKSGMISEKLLLERKRLIGKILVLKR
jgi:hypothetical protein